MNSALTSLVLFLALPLSAVGQEIGTVTFAESALRVIRGATVYAGAEGVRLRQGDILENGEGGFAQLELSGGTIAVLGPSSRLFLFRHGRAGEMVLLRGWLKGEGASSSGAYRYGSPLLGASTKDGTVVLRAGENIAEIFVESGSANVSEISSEGNWGHAVSAKTGQFFTRQAGKNVGVTPRPTATFVDAVPPAFRDTLPSRLARFSGKKPVELRRDHEASFPEIQAWLTMGRAWRRGFVERFQSRLKDSAFREGVEKHLGELAEWDPVLHPEKYAPKTPAPAESSNSPHGRY
jgi:hypothetical protein